MVVGSAFPETGYRENRQFGARVNFCIPGIANVIKFDGNECRRQDPRPNIATAPLGVLAMGPNFIAQHFDGPHQAVESQEERIYPTFARIGR